MKETIDKQSKDDWSKWVKQMSEANEKEKS